MKIENLRGLSRAYAAGELDRAGYRHERAALLKAIAAGELPVIPWHPPEPDTPTVFPDDDDEGDTTQEILPQAAISRRGRPAWLGWAVGVIVLAIGGALGWQYLLGEKAAPPATPPAPEVAVQAPAAPSTPDLFSVFLAGERWSPEYLEGLLREWNHLGAEARDTLREGASAGRLVDAVLAQIAQEDALINLGDAEEALDTQEQLLDLVEGLGLADSRIEAARAAWTQARENRLQAMSAPEAPPVAEAAPEVPAAQAEGATAASEPAGEAPAVAAAETATPETPAASEPEPPAATPPVRSPETPAAAPEPTRVAEATDAPAAPPETRGAAADGPAEAAADDPEPAAAPEAESASVAPAAPKTARSGARTNCRAELARKRRPYCIDMLESGVKGPVLVVLPPGEFEMGGRDDAEQPRHRVAIPSSFALGMFEVSVAELATYCEAAGVSCPEQPWSNPAYPAVNVSWAFAREYAAWLSGVTGATYRLPSEAEWEYAARAGTSTPYAFGEEIVPTDAHYSFKAALDEPLPANDRSVNRNDFRLYHMLGNVREWVEDAWHANHQGAPTDGSARSGASGERVVRGGSYADTADALRSAARVPLPANGPDRYTGFRLVRTID